MNRIMWNRQPKHIADLGDIDEIVIHNCTLHIEQMGDNEYWIGVTLVNGQEFIGWISSDTPIRFMQRDDSTIVWDKQATQETMP